MPQPVLAAPTKAKLTANVAQTNRQLKLQSRPKGLLAPGDLQLAEAPLPSLTDGQALARVKYLSIDPTMRVWMAIDSYLPAVAIGEVMRGFGFAEVVESRHKEFKKGDKVVGLTGLQDYCVIEAADKRSSFQKVPPVPFLSDTAFLGVLGVTGITAAKRRNAGGFRSGRRHWQHCRTNRQNPWMPRGWHRRRRGKMQMAH